jgi:hypothetical protein
MVSVAVAPALADHDRTDLPGLEAHLAQIPPDAVIFDDYDVSSWMLFHVPQASLVIDSRVELFDQHYVSGYYDAVMARPGWQDFVEQTGASWAVLKAEAPLSQAMLKAGDWAAVETADGYMLLERMPAQESG